MSMPRFALITGAGTGIGRAAALALAADGFGIALAGRRIEPLRAVEDELKARGVRTLVVQADVADESSVQALFASVVAAFGRLDLLFNNAGASARAAPIEALTLAEWRRVFDVNVTGLFLCTREALLQMKRQSPRGGRIINNGSIAAHVPRPHGSAYAASKHAVLGLTKSTALEGRPFGIACGQIDVGNASTEIGSHASVGALQADGRTLPEPMMDLVHVAEAVRYMASLPPEANVLTMTVMATGMPYVGRG